MLWLNILINLIITYQGALKSNTMMRSYKYDTSSPYSGWAYLGLLTEMGGGGSTKICHTYPTMMKLGTGLPYLKKIQNIYESRDTPLEFCWNQHFFTGNQQILLYREMQILIAFWYIISNSFNFFWVFIKIALINMVIILLMSAKMAT